MAVVNEFRRWAALVSATGLAAGLLTGCGAAPGSNSAIARSDCGSARRPAPIVLRVASPRADLCFGGGVGAVTIPGTVVTVFESGDYTACVGREASSTCLDPGHRVTLGTTITGVGICPDGDWSGCLDRLPPAVISRFPASP
ncbi:hypothetical protein ACIRSS_24295 [Amycolatopsis sp. NPDC101161]|uniref:hypothetical protein n=1 Tax=Amycolatopsis sp. NPDC101161 TaxID=3363940 RepID=UPI00381FD238